MNNNIKPVQSKLINTNLNSNGIYSNTTYITELDDIYINFKAKVYKTSDKTVKSNVNHICQEYYQSNIIIDSRMLLTITYAANMFQDLFIYNVNTNQVLTLYQFIKSKLLISKTLTIDEYIDILNLFMFINYFCCQTIIWNSDLAIKSLSHSSKNMFNVVMLERYLTLTMRSLKLRDVSMLEFIDIKKVLTSKNNMTQLNRPKLTNILYSTRELLKTTKYVMLN